MGEAQAGLYHDVSYAGGVVMNASACVAPDLASPPSGDVYASLAIEIYDGQDNVQSQASDVAMSNLSDVGELMMSATAVDGGMARFVLLVTSESAADEGGFLFDRVWMGDGEAPGCADLVPQSDAGDSDGRGDTDDPETVESECSCSSSGSPLGAALFLPVVALLRRRRVSC